MCVYNDLKWLQQEQILVIHIRMQNLQTSWLDMLPILSVENNMMWLYLLEFTSSGVLLFVTNQYQNTLPQQGASRYDTSIRGRAQQSITQRVLLQAKT